MEEANHIPFFSFDHTSRLINAEIKQTFDDFLSSQHFILGTKLLEFEAGYAAYSGTRQCIGVGNGLDALQIALKTLKIGPGDEVIVPTNTFIATWLAVSFTGATIIPVEPDPCTYNLDPLKVADALTHNTKVILPVHLYGQVCEMDKLMNLSKAHDLYIVEDNAQAHGARFKGRLTGSFGDINATSFYPTKNFGALGDAGALTTDNSDLANQARLLRNYGSAKKYHHEMIGFNSRLDELQAAFLNVKLRYMANLTADRQRAATIYNTELQDVGDLVLPAVHPQSEHVYHVYVVRTHQRDALEKFLKDHNIGTLIHYPVPPHLQPAYRGLGFPKGCFPIAEELATTSISLPLFPGITPSQSQRVVDIIKAFYA